MNQVYDSGQHPPPVATGPPPGYPPVAGQSVAKHVPPNFDEKVNVDDLPPSTENEPSAPDDLPSYAEYMGMSLLLLSF